MFGDVKENGFDLESTHLRPILKLYRLTFTIVLLFLKFLASARRS
jgi:hypothetical protein